MAVPHTFQTREKRGIGKQMMCMVLVVAVCLARSTRVFPPLVCLSASYLIRIQDPPWVSTLSLFLVYALLWGWLLGLERWWHLIGYSAMGAWSTRKGMKILVPCIGCVLGVTSWVSLYVNVFRDHPSMDRMAPYWILMVVVLFDVLASRTASYARSVFSVLFLAAGIEMCTGLGNALTPLVPLFVSVWMVRNSETSLSIPHFTTFYWSGSLLSSHFLDHTRKITRRIFSGPRKNCRDRSE